jgi:2-desacetyl-2-hydroxyethyl bacteriochlorophyllide A dehydrogenase
MNSPKSQATTSRTFQKIVFRGTQAELVQATLPEIADDQILVRSRCSLISPGTERAALTRLWNDETFRENPGYALAGDVMEIGRQAGGFALGDRVLLLHPHASLAVASTAPWLTLKIPESLSYETATFVPLASVALHALRRARIELGETFAVFGAGIIGLTAIQLAKMDGARKVFALDFAQNRLDLARRYGADLVLNPSDPETVAKVLHATNGVGVPVILEATGNPRAVLEAFKLAAPGGRIMCVGVMEEAIPISFHREFIQRELSLIAAFQPFCPTTDNLYWPWTQQANRQLLLEFLAAGTLRVDEMLTHRVPAERSPEVYERLRRGDPEMIGVLLEWSPGG